jgi:hypothetical protein
VPRRGAKEESRYTVTPRSARATLDDALDDATFQHNPDIGLKQQTNETTTHLLPRVLVLQAVAMPLQGVPRLFEAVVMMLEAVAMLLEGCRFRAVGSKPCYDRNCFEPFL